MDKKRFACRDYKVNYSIQCEEISDNGNWITYGQIVDLLNEQDATIQHLKEVVHRYEYSIDLKERTNTNLHLDNLKLEKENEQLKHDATVLIQSNTDYRKENEQLRKDLIDHSALISILEDYQALPIEEILWNLTGVKSEEEFNELYKPYLDKAKECWND